MGEKEGARLGGKGQEISVINRRHPANFTQRSPCDTYSVSIKLKPETIKKKILSDASCYNVKIDNI